MSKKIQRTIITFLVMAFTFCVGLFATTANGASATSEVTTFKMIDGASIRTQSDSMGIRFAATISAEDYNKLSGAEFGMLIAPADFIADEAKFAIGEMAEYNKDTTYSESDIYFARSKVTPELDTEDYDNDGDTSEYVLKCSFVGIKESNRSRPFAARAYYKASGTTEYVYTSITNRAVYTVASKALAAGALDAEEYSDAKAHFEDVVDYVNQYYTDLSVTVDGIENNAAEIGSKFTVSATVTNPNSNKTLDAGVSVAALKNKQATDIISANNDGSYSVNYLGDFDLAVSVGKEKALNKTIAIDNQDTMAIFNSEASASNVVKYDASTSVIDLTFNKNFVGGNSLKQNVLTYSKPDTTVSGDLYQHAFTFTSDFRKIMKAGTYLYMEVMFEGAGSGWSSIYHNDYPGTAYKFSDYADEYTDIRKWYKADGSLITGRIAWSSSIANTWLKLEYQLQEDYAGWFSIYNAHINSNYVGAVHFANIIISAEPLEDLTVDYDYYYDATAYLGDSRNKADSWTFGEMETANGIGGRDGVKKFAVDASVKGDGTAAYFDPSNTANLASKFTADRYLYVDVYVPAGPNPYFAVKIVTDDSKTTHNIHESYQGTGTNADYRLLYNNNGTLTPCTKTWGGYFGQWLTIEIKFNVDCTKQDGYQNATRYCFYFTTDQATDFGENQKIVYFDNARITELALA